MSKVEEYTHSRLGDFVNAYTSAVQALADAKEELHNRLFAPEHISGDLEEIDRAGAGKAVRRDRTAESRKPNGMGAADERLQGTGRGSCEV